LIKWREEGGDKPYVIVTGGDSS